MSMSRREKKTMTVVAVLAAVTVIAVAVTVWALFFRGNDVVLTPDYAPIAEESHAEAIGDGDESKLDAPTGGGAASLLYQKKVAIDLSDKKASLLFGNPTRSTQNMVVQLVVQDNIIVQSGLLTPGNKVTTLDLLNGKESLLKEGGYEGKLIVLCYDPKTGEKAIVNTEIPVDITVKE